MNSFNHYAYGAIGDWMYRELGGINSSEKVSEVGYKKIIVKPHMENNFVSEEVRKANDNKTLSEVNAALDTYYGTVKSHWKKTDDKAWIEVSIPVNTTADIYIPITEKSKILEGKKPLESAKNVKIVEENEQNIIVSVGSGTYAFTIQQ